MAGPTNASSQSLAVPPFHQSRRPTMASSLAVSDTSSFHQREVELLAVEKRFAGVLARSEPRQPRPSKFKEEFDAPSFPGLLSRSSMLLQKLHIPIPDLSRPRSRSGGIFESPRTQQRRVDERSKPLPEQTAQPPSPAPSMLHLSGGEGDQQPMEKPIEGLKPSATDL